jgi:hypothetical protein
MKKINSLTTTGAKNQQEADLKKIELRSKLYSQKNESEQINNIEAFAVPPPPASQEHFTEPYLNNIGNINMSIPIATPISNSGVLLEGEIYQKNNTNNTDNNIELNNEIKRNESNNITLERIEILRNKRIIYIENMKCFAFILLVGITGFVIWRVTS